jgi:hypothetical protein
LLWRFTSIPTLLVDISTKDIRDRYGSMAAVKRKALEDPTVKIQLDEIIRLDGMIGDGMRIVSVSVACLHDAYALLRLLEEGCTVDARIPKLYYDALQIAVANRDQAKAKVIPLRLDS